MPPPALKHVRGLRTVLNIEYVLNKCLITIPCYYTIYQQIVPVFSRVSSLQDPVGRTSIRHSEYPHCQTGPPSMFSIHHYAKKVSVSILKYTIKCFINYTELFVCPLGGSICSRSQKRKGVLSDCSRCFCSLVPHFSAHHILA